MKTYYFDLHVFYSRDNGFSIPLEIKSESTPTEEEVIDFAVHQVELDPEDMNNVDYVQEIDQEEYERMRAIP